ncbi:MAG: AAA family ATPase [Clostridia bacterium]|nr:AAA family ATPase [Clostridia bacterium]
MLRNLYIENIAVIQQADIDFSIGLTVLSGETGAGKSIIIDALSAILGGRVSRDLIRTGQSKACVVGTLPTCLSRCWNWHGSRDLSPRKGSCSSAGRCLPTDATSAASTAVPHPFPT